MPSFTELAREGQQVERWNLLHPLEERKVSHVTKLLKNAQGPVIASTDYIRALVDQIRGLVPNKFVVLGTDGYGRSDTREKLRHFFEVDRYWVTVAALNALADEGTIDRSSRCRGDQEVRAGPVQTQPDDGLTHRPSSVAGTSVAPQPDFRRGDFLVDHPGDNKQ